ncbi:hypothetical protein FH609_000465 [Streptomyces sp. 3MP-14]|uniref:Uncharacterized protein n=1 Tax=Streptomyces mimosae TaxID=2586635 RepID=A0A5N6AR75_9ACTN|nr:MULTISPECIES: hypothetical protein [Streptomyces]KAB8171114.1 hypothetical protein FH607_002005 [Streptomyces mimosae]KAB8179534.1 hypothetical protein FH609_000465 [Streptomyces sp. 3MP-14]
MPAPASRAQDIAARLSAAGFTPRLTRHPTHIRIEADVPATVSPERWHLLLAALALGDRFGLTGDAEQRTAWAHIHHGQSATATHHREPTT